MRLKKDTWLIFLVSYQQVKVYLDNIMTRIKDDVAQLFKILILKRSLESCLCEAVWASVKTFHGQTLGNTISYGGFTCLEVSMHVGFVFNSYSFSLDHKLGSTK